MLENFPQKPFSCTAFTPIPSYDAWHFSITSITLAFCKAMSISLFVRFALLVPTSNRFSLCPFQNHPFLKSSVSCVLRKVWGLIPIFTRPDFMGIHLCGFIYQCFITFYGGSIALCGHKKINVIIFLFKSLVLTST